MSGYVELRNVKKIYHMGEVDIEAAAGIDFQIRKGRVCRHRRPQRRGQDHGAQYPRRHGHGHGRARCWWTGRISPGIPGRS